MKCSVTTNVLFAPLTLATFQIRKLASSSRGVMVWGFLLFVDFQFLQSYFRFFTFLDLGLVQADYNIFPLGTKQGWSGWNLLIVDSIRGGKGGSS